MSSVYQQTFQLRLITFAINFTMLNLTISFQKSFKHFIDFELTFVAKRASDLSIQLPAWRPGRYELADFSKNIQKFEVFDEQGKPIKFKKVTKDNWYIDTNWENQEIETKEITISYNFYANKLDAGSTYLDDKQLYINPVNCCFYIVGKENQEYKIDLKIPEDYQLASGLKQISKHSLLAQNFDQLAECPIIASASLSHYKYEVNNIPFHIWIQGESELDANKMCQDFKDFTVEQINCFGSFPVKDYHFLFQLTPYNSYHGVEHTNSTVILLGSKNQVLKERYEALLGICSHELYHTWNIKSIRPIEMFPYDYSKENYSRLGYVAEGVTTYMGDLMLKRAKVFSWDQFKEKINQNIKRHYENDGRFNLSVSESGFDSWLDGYSLGIPNRKTNIYTEGSLNMLMIDLAIINHSNRKYSLNNVMKELYENWGLKNKGFNEKEFVDLCVKYGGDSVSQIIKDHVYDTIDYTNSLKQNLTHVGIELKPTLNSSLSARFFGFICLEENKKMIVKKIQENALIEQHEIAVDDELLSIDKHLVNSENINKLLENKEEVSLKFKNKFSTKDIKLKTNSSYYNYYQLEKIDSPTSDQVQSFNFWLNEK